MRTPAVYKRATRKLVALMVAVSLLTLSESKAKLAQEKPGQTLQATALVNEAYLRLLKDRPDRWQNRAHFFGVAAQIMRRILVDFARRRPRVERDQEAIRMSLDEAMTVSAERDPDLGRGAQAGAGMPVWPVEIPQSPRPARGRCGGRADPGWSARA